MSYYIPSYYILHIIYYTGDMIYPLTPVVGVTFLKKRKNTDILCILVCMEQFNAHLAHNPGAPPEIWAHNPGAPPLKI